MEYICLKFPLPVIILNIYNDTTYTSVFFVNLLIFHMKVLCALCVMWWLFHDFLETNQYCDLAGILTHAVWIITESNALTHLAEDITDNTCTPWPLPKTVQWIPLIQNEFVKCSCMKSRTGLVQSVNLMHYVDPAVT